jgi:hypothetical protein
MTPDKAAEMWAFSRNSLGKEQGIIFPIRDFQKGIREFSDPYRETHPWWSGVEVPPLCM